MDVRAAEELIAFVYGSLVSDGIELMCHTLLVTVIVCTAAGRDWRAEQGSAVGLQLAHQLLEGAAAAEICHQEAGQQAVQGMLVFGCFY
jgi:hypothetical protein